MLAFARLRELLGASREIDIPAGTNAAGLWQKLAQSCPNIDELARSTRIARNGRIVEGAEQLFEGDEVALLPPVGGG